MLHPEFLPINSWLADCWAGFAAQHASRRYSLTNALSNELHMHDQWLTHTHTYLHLPLSQTDSVISLLTHSLRLITDSVMSLRTSRPSMECSLPDCQVFTKTTSNQLITLYCITFHCITLHCITSLHCTSHHFNLQRSKKRGCRLKRWHGRPVA